MDYQKIKYFLKAAETLNFSEAARQMYITPQAFGKQIALLEQEMGFSLFERSTRQTKLTDSGQICYEHFSGLVTNLEKEYLKMCELGSKRNKQIRLGVFNALSRKKVVSPIVSNILAGFPDRDVSISMCDMGQLQANIQNGTLDLCLTMTHESETGWDNCNRLSLKSYPAQIVVSGYHKWVVQDVVTVDDMKVCDFVKMDLPQFSQKDYFVNVPCENRILVENYETMCLRLDRGDCFTTMAADIDSYTEKSGKAFPLPWGAFNFELALIYDKNNPHSFLPELCQFIQEVFET